MITSGQWSFNLTLPQIIEQAYSRIGSEMRTGWNYRDARISLDLLLLEWQNRGLNTWTIKNGSQVLTAGTASYALPAERLDIVEAVIRTDDGNVTAQQDINIERVSVTTYAQQTNKLTTGRPTQYYVQRSPEGITIFLWPVPDNGDYKMNYWYLERVEDTGNSGTYSPDIPARYLPALIAGLAYQLGLKSPKVYEALPRLESEYERQWELAADASREKAALRLVPDRSAY